MTWDVLVETGFKGGNRRGGGTWGVENGEKTVWKKGELSREIQKGGKEKKCTRLCV